MTVEFRDLGSSTEVCLTHQNFLNPEDRDKHNQGWLGCFAQLQTYLAS